MQRLLELSGVLTRALGKRGLDIVHPCSIRAYNLSAKVVANPRVRLPGGGADGNRGLGFIVGNSRAFWPLFIKEFETSRARVMGINSEGPRAQPGTENFVLYGSPNPIEDFVTDVVVKLLRSPSLSKERAVVRFAHRTEDGLLYAAQHLSEVAGLATYYSSVGLS